MLTNREKREYLLSLVSIEIEAYQDTILELINQDDIGDHDQFAIAFYKLVIKQFKVLHDQIATSTSCDEV